MTDDMIFVLLTIGLFIVSIAVGLFADWYFHGRKRTRDWWDDWN